MTQREVFGRPLRPRVSICLNSYNHARWLADAIESALSQTFRDFEIVIVDDGSTDGSYDIARSYEREDEPPIRVLTHSQRRNLGVAYSMNLGFREGIGEYWAWLPSDDRWYPDKLSSQVAYLDQNREVAFVYGYADVIDEDGRVSSDSPIGIDITGSRDPLRRVIEGNVVPAMTVMTRRSCVEAVGGLDDSLVYNDWELWIRLMARWNAGFISKPLAQFRVHSYNTSVGMAREVDARRRIAVLRSVLAKSSTVQGRLYEPRTRAALYVELARVYFETGRLESAKRRARAIGAALLPR